VHSICAIFLEISCSQFAPIGTSFYQLTVIRDKQGNYEEAIRLSRLALEQGWAGDWERRIVRYEKKLLKRGRVKD
jgi:hypothetical protein